MLCMCKKEYTHTFININIIIFLQIFLSFIIHIKYINKKAINKFEMFAILSIILFNDNLNIKYCLFVYSSVITHKL